ncbi:ATP-binding protein [Nocardia salmonicida]|uniref:ATP-binding protein n=1 Tax=Nocardia salmonicida TaxID=53431 RepID=UPI0033D7E2A7
MSPRPGGEADKIGNSYEAAWIVARMLDVLQGQADWMKIEPLGDLRNGAEFVIRRADGIVEAHQVKRQFANSNAWNSGALERLGIWEAALYHSRAGRHFHFVSTVPFRKLQELADRAESSDDLTSFIDDGLPRPLDELFSELSERYGGATDAYQVVRQLHVRLIDDRELRHSNAGLAGLLLEGAPGLPTRASLAELIERCIGRTVHSADLLELLRTYGIQRRLLTSLLSLTEQVQRETSMWSQRVKRQLLQPVIERGAAQEIFEIPSQPAPVTFLVGGAGAGKTAVLHQAIDLLASDGVVTLVISLDRYELLGSTRQLGNLLGFETSPVTALAAAERPAVLVVDQLDAVSMVSGRLPENFDVVLDLIDEAAAFPELRVVLGCRQFDVDNDYRIRSLMSRNERSVVSVRPLTDSQIDGAVAAMGLAADSLTAYQRGILRLPLHLSLLATIAREPTSLNFTNSQVLFDTYWDYKRRVIRNRCAWANVDAATAQVARAISDRQLLTVPIALLDIDGTTADLLISEQLLVRDGSLVQFFHEAIFDYAFARQWVRSADTLVDFLTSSEQELFRRGQVRQIMTHLRASDPTLFLTEVRAMLTHSDIRFHVKDAALAVLGSLHNPSRAEGKLLLDVAAAVPELDSRLWSRLRTPPWFDRLDADGLLSQWLAGSEKESARALLVMAGAGPARAGRVADLAIVHRARHNYPQWIRYLVRFMTLQSDHKAVALVIDCIEAGCYDDYGDNLWLQMRGLAVAKPDWVVEVLAAYFSRPLALAIGISGKISALTRRDTFFAQVVTTVAISAPSEFCAALLPYLQQVMSASEIDRQGDSPVWDEHFSFRLPRDGDREGDVAEVFITAMGSAIRAMATNDPTALRPHLDVLAEDPHEAAQWLLYQGIIANGTVFASWAVELILQGPRRFRCGYVSNGVWVAREVLRAICQYITPEQHEQLETMIRDHSFEWQNRGPGWYTFNLLSGLCEDRLTERGRRRLGEFRRRFAVNQPPEPEGITVYRVEEPIPSERARYMSDENWLQAIAVHTSDDDTASRVGGAREQARVLEEAARDDPFRFARLTLRLTPTVVPDYTNALLLGLGAAAPVDDSLTIFAAVRHIVSMNNPGNDRFFGHALQPYIAAVPLDMVEILRERMVNAVDPEDDGIRVWHDEQGVRRAEIQASGINTARGSLALTLARLLASDVDGARTALVAPVLIRMAEDHSVPVRTAVAHLIGASMRHAPEAGRTAFMRLIDDEDLVLASPPVRQLLMYLGNDDPTVVMPVVERMLTSVHSNVREEGGRLATFAALEWQRPQMLEAAEVLGPEVRQGIAHVAAHRITATSESHRAAELLKRCFYDPSSEVRKSAAEVVPALRGEPLEPFAALLREFINSPAFGEGIAQLLITLEAAPDRIDDLILHGVRQFITVAGPEVGDLSTHAAADSHHVSQLLVRGLAQTDDSDERSALLDAIDELFRLGALGIDDVVGASERG